MRNLFIGKPLKKGRVTIGTIKDVTERGESIVMMVELKSVVHDNYVRTGAVVWLSMPNEFEINNTRIKI